MIDDDSAMRYTLARILRKGEFEVVMADDGEHGLAMFRKERPDLIICDLIMPQRDGLDTIAQVRRESPAMKIIAISGGSLAMNADGLAAALAAGATEVVVKPFRAEDILDRVTRLLAG